MVLDLFVIEHAKESMNASTAEHATIKVLSIQSELSHNQALGFLLAAGLELPLQCLAFFGLLGDVLVPKLKHYLCCWLNKVLHYCLNCLMSLSIALERDRVWHCDVRVFHSLNFPA